MNVDAEKIAHIRQGEVAEFVFLCVPTPEGPDGAADLSAVDAVAREVAPLLAADAVVVTKSTMPVGSAAALGRTLRDEGAPAGVAVAANPEFLREGMAVDEFLHPSRIVIGAEDETVAARVAELYDGVDAPIVMTEVASAENSRLGSVVDHRAPHAGRGRACHRPSRVDREGARVRREFREEWTGIHVVELDEVTYEAAADFAVTLGVRTLDAPRLAAAYRVGGGALPFLTYGLRLAQAARSLGWSVLGT